MEDRVLAKPADLCCIRGAIHTGEAVGKMEQIGGIDTYVARPAPERSNGNVLLFFSDALGLHINSFLLMDAFAECGYLTLGVDYFLGDAIGKYSKNPLNDPNFDFTEWKDRHYTASEEVAEKWIAAVKELHGKSDSVKFACVGYCWGARFVCRQLSDKGICKVGAIAHPSFVMESDIKAVNGPLFLSVPSKDKLFEVAERNRTVEILADADKHFNMQIFSHVGHGFASRAELTDPYERWAKEQSFRSFADWFDTWLPRL